LFADFPVLRLFLVILAGLLGLILLVTGLVGFAMTLSHRSTTKDKVGAVAIGLAGVVLASTAVLALLYPLPLWVELIGLAACVGAGIWLWVASRPPRDSRW
jgi:hypothetical protein